MRALLSLALLVVLTLAASAAELRLAWNPNPAADEVREYAVYEIPASGLAVLMRTTAATQATLEVVPGVHTYVVTARNLWDESLPSDSVATPSAKPSRPTGLRITILMHADGRAELLVSGPEWRITCIEASADLVRWEPICQRLNVAGQFAFIDPDSARLTSRFYRATVSSEEV